MSDKYVENVVLFKALADTNRLMIIDMLSHHMKILCECGLINWRKEGKWMSYTLDEKKVQDLKNFLCGIVRAQRRR